MQASDHSSPISEIGYAREEEVASAIEEIEEASDQKEIARLGRCLASSRKNKPQDGGRKQVHQRTSRLNRAGVKRTRPRHGAQGSRLCAGQHRDQRMANSLVQDIRKHRRQKADGADGERIAVDGM